MINILQLTRMGRLGAALLLALGLSACVSVQIPAPSASADNIEKLRAAPIAPAGIGAFVLAPGKPKDMDTTLGGLRGSSMAPSTGSFALHLREQLVAELKAAGLYAPDSKLLIEGQLTDSKVDAAIGTGTGRLAARFIVKREGQVVFDKELAAESSWESSFVGATAIPLAMNQYGALYKALVGKLIDDPQFRAALAR